MSQVSITHSEGDFSFRTWPFYWLTRASGRYLQNMEEALRPIGLDIPRWRVLMVLHEEECASVSEIADHAISKLSTMTKIVQRMQADGLVICRPRASDARVTEVLLTEAGKKAGEKAWQAANGVYSQAFKSMRKSDIGTLNRLLEQLATKLAGDGPAGAE
ncbi:MarR family winged helix-turn-helix transcriptional regulator [Flavisphingomonas formosensis]|uniref:MarR family winged helix-turn-helix transcriptional regulator n=1 Tax=Flavisphingomonas formosensis TaxID=861534 RepID=UPI0012F7BE1C|nr:MarR family transcriptional regulator [Sphingomonas formosensis]